MPVWLAIIGAVSCITLGWSGFYFTFNRPGRQARNEFFRLALASDGSNGLPPHKDIFTLLAKVVEQLAENKDRLTKVEAQLQANGGNSARDMLDKIHAVTVSNFEKFARVEANANDARRATNQLRAEVNVVVDSVIDDRARIWKALGALGIDRRQAEDI